MSNSPALAVNFIGLVLSIWLGVYIITRGRRSWVAWSSGLTLWYLAGFFANILFFLFSKPVLVSQPLWIRLLFPFWPQVSNGNIPSWTQAWAAGLGILFWYQTTVLIIPGRIVTWRRLSLLAGYLLAGATLVLQITMPDLIVVEKADPLLVDTQRFNSFYAVFALSFLLYKRDFLLDYIKMAPTPLEVAESVDMMRILENGIKVKMVPTIHESYSIDVDDDKARVEAFLEKNINKQ